jgi:hypothetical protein
VNPLDVARRALLEQLRGRAWELAGGTVDLDYVRTFHDAFWPIVTEDPYLALLEAVITRNDAVQVIRVGHVVSTNEQRLTIPQIPPELRLPVVPSNRKEKRKAAALAGRREARPGERRR